MRKRLLSHVVNRPLNSVGLHLVKKTTLSHLLSLSPEVERLQMERDYWQAKHAETAADLDPREASHQAEVQRLRGEIARLQGELGLARAGQPGAKSAPPRETSLFEPPWHVERPTDCTFYHTMDLPGFGVVHGAWDLRGDFDDYVGHVELRGRSVLDLGTASGFLTFEAERRGARVVSFDVGDASNLQFLPFKDKPQYANPTAWVADMNWQYDTMKKSYWLAHRLYGSQALVHYGNIYRLPEALGKFDVAFVGSILEHLSDPISALGSISKVTAERMVINTPYLDTEEKIARLIGSGDHPEYDYVWWYYSLGTYKTVFAMLGFALERVHWHNYAHSFFDGTARRSGSQPRATIVARRLS
jgi:SAM-dependent methyltransferase